ncbi:MAG: serine hydrolase [Alphaproteobacteria bacterium]|nr:MAG: serine hydrolase [Alphaproteobacteria bacterium]
MRGQWGLSRWAAGLGLAACMGFGAAAADVPDVTDPAVVEAFVDGAVKPPMEINHSPSGVVAVMKDGKMIFAKGYGYIDVEKHIPVDAETSLFRPGSISKLFTWVSVMQQVEQGKLDLDTDVNTYLTQFKVKDSWPGKPVTLRHILTHTAGFEDGGVGYLITDDPSRIVPLADSLMTHQPERVYEPGTMVAYSNWATALAGLIVANVSGESFNDYVENHIFNVLGMASSSFREPLPANLDANMAKAYGWEAGKYVEKKYEIISNFGPAGASAVTASDMGKFACALLADGACNGARILKAETLEQMLDEGFSHDPRVRGTGLGFLKRPFGPDGFDNFGHDGATTMFISHFGMSKKEDFMLFSSFSGPGARATHVAFVDAFYKEFFPNPAPVLTAPADFASRAQKYAGKYNNSRNSYTKAEAIMRGLGTATVTPMPDNTLLIEGKRYVEIEHNLFQLIDGTDRIAFQEDADGNITGYVLDGFGVMRFYRAGFQETTGFTTLVVGLSLTVFLFVFLRLAYQFAAFRALKGEEKQAWTATLLVAGFYLMFFILAGMSISGGVDALFYALPAMLKFSFVFPILAALALVWHLYLAYRVWTVPLFAGKWQRIRHTVVSLVGLLMLWFTWYWNLLGFHYFD